MGNAELLRLLKASIADHLVLVRWSQADRATAQILAQEVASVRVDWAWWIDWQLEERIREWQELQARDSQIRQRLLELEEEGSHID